VHRRNLIVEKEFENLNEKIDLLLKKLNGYISYLKKQAYNKD
jgi:hypothetical protein